MVRINLVGFYCCLNIQNCTLENFPSTLGFQTISVDSNTSKVYEIDFESDDKRVCIVVRKRTTVLFGMNIGDTRVPRTIETRFYRVYCSLKSYSKPVYEIVIITLHFAGDFRRFRKQLDYFYTFTKCEIFIF